MMAAPNVVNRGAYGVLSRSHVLTVLPETSDGEIRALLDTLRAEAASAGPETRRAVHFHALKALSETGHAEAWADELDVALGVRYGPERPPAPAARPIRKPKNPALRLWRFEVSRGIGGQRADAPSTWRYDVLWEAASLESEATNLEAQESWETAARLRVQARALLARALAERGQGTAA